MTVGQIVYLSAGALGLSFLLDHVVFRVVSVTPEALTVEREASLSPPVSGLLEEDALRQRDLVDLSEDDDELAHAVKQNHRVRHEAIRDELERLRCCGTTRLQYTVHRNEPALIGRATVVYGEQPQRVQPVVHLHRARLTCRQFHLPKHYVAIDMVVALGSVWLLLADGLRILQLTVTGEFQEIIELDEAVEPLRRFAAARSHTFFAISEHHLYKFDSRFGMLEQRASSRDGTFVALSARAGRVATLERTTDECFRPVWRAITGECFSPFWMREFSQTDADLIAGTNPVPVRNESINDLMLLSVGQTRWFRTDESCRLAPMSTNGGQARFVKATNHSLELQSQGCHLVEPVVLLERSLPGLEMHAVQVYNETVWLLLQATVVQVPLADFHRDLGQLDLESI